MRVIILEHQNLNKTFYKNFELDHKSNEIEFQFWSLLPLMNKKLYKLYSNKKYRTISNSKFILIKSYKHLFKKINGIKKKTYFLNETRNFLSILIEFFLIKRGCLKIERFEQKVSSTTYNSNIYADLKKLIDYGPFFLLRKIITRILSVLKNFLLKKITADPNYYITTNNNSYDELIKKKLNSKVFKYNSGIFNQFKKIANQKLKKKNIVFIDQEIESSFESKFTKTSSYLNNQKYWNCLNQIFNYFEKKFKVKIVIAAHFRRKNDKKNLPNIGRKFIFDKTPELIRNSKLVIGHHSTALEYAILMRKPILLLNFRIFDSIAVRVEKQVNFLRKAISPKIIHIDNMYKIKFNKKIFKSLFKINKKKYDNFRNYYINFKSNKNVNQNIWTAISSIR